MGSSVLEQPGEVQCLQFLIGVPSPWPRSVCTHVQLPSSVAFLCWPAVLGSCTVENPQPFPQSHRPGLPGHLPRLCGRLGDC